MDPATIMAIGGAIVIVCGAISAAVPDTKLGRFAGVINKVGLNFGFAGNDEEKNK